MGLANELTLGTVRPPAVHMTIGTLPASDPALLPHLPLATLRTVPPAQIATLGFYSYPNLVSLGGTTESVYSTPKTIGTLVGICRAPTADAGATGECERILATVRLASGRVLGTAGGVSYAKGTRRRDRERTAASLCAPHRQPDHTRGFRNLTPRAGFS